MIEMMVQILFVELQCLLLFYLICNDVKNSGLEEI